MAHPLGYARISTGEQHPDLQVDALKAAGCYRVFVDTASGALAARPALDQVLDQLRPGDTLMVWKLDRLGRSCATWSTPLPPWPTAGSGSARCKSPLIPRLRAASWCSTSSPPWPSSNATSSANAQRLGWLLLGPVAARAADRWR